jgi:hypothetical protein
MKINRFKLADSRGWIATLVALLSMPATSKSSFGDTPGGPIVLQHAEYTSTAGNLEQQFATAIDLRQKDGTPLKDNSVPLTLTFFNGPNNQTKFSWIRVYITDQPVRNMAKPGRPYGKLVVTEANFKDTAKVEMPATGSLRPGYTFMINGAGVKGAKFSWEVATPPPGAMQITTLQPIAPRAGGAMSIIGTGFSTIPSQNVVYLNQKQAKVAQATATLLELEVPADLTPGNYSVQVTVKGTKSNVLSAKVKGAPELTRTDWQAGPCGQTVTIYGKNFSEKADENNVFFGKERATVTGATSETLTVTVPQFPELNGANAYLNPTPMDITVSVGTTPAKGRLQFYSARNGWQ